jgi:hypothetical protein
MGRVSGCEGANILAVSILVLALLAARIAVSAQYKTLHMRFHG